MSSDTSHPVPPLPRPKMRSHGSDTLLFSPLSRRGHGPGLIILVPDYEGSPLVPQNGVPSCLWKWAEEGYAVVEISSTAFTQSDDPLKSVPSLFEDCKECDDTGKIGLIGAFHQHLTHQD